MPRPRVYLDTSVFGGVHDAEFAEYTRRFFDRVKRGDLVLSWNFTHIDRYDRIRMFNGVNALKGYRALDIRSPMEVTYGNEDQEL